MITWWCGLTSPLPVEVVLGLISNFEIGIVHSTFRIPMQAEQLAELGLTFTASHEVVVSQVGVVEERASQQHPGSQPQPPAANHPHQTGWIGGWGLMNPNNPAAAAAGPSSGSGSSSRSRAAVTGGGGGGGRQGGGASSVNSNGPGGVLSQPPMTRVVEVELVPGGANIPG